MKLIIERADALATLSRVTGVVARNSNVPILNNVLITASDDGRVTFRATDLDMEATASCAAQVSIPGVLTVDAGKLREVVASAAAGSEISMELDESDDPRLVVKSGRSRFKLPVIGADSFPSFPVSSGDSTFEVVANDVTKLFKVVSGFASTEVTRYYLNGVYLHIADGKLRAVATNGHVLSYQDISLPVSALDMGGVIVPNKMVSEILKAVDGKSGEATISVSGTSITASVGNHSIQSKVVDGSFPDYTRVVPKDTTSVALLYSDDLVAAAQRASIASEGKAKSAVFLFSGDRLEVSGRGQAEARDEIECDFNGADLRIGFNSAYVIQCANAIDGAIEILMSDPVSPTIWRAPNDETALSVLVPMRL